MCPLAVLMREAFERTCSDSFTLELDLLVVGGAAAAPHHRHRPPGRRQFFNFYYESLKSDCISWWSFSAGDLMSRRSHCAMSFFLRKYPLLLLLNLCLMRCFPYVSCYSSHYIMSRIYSTSYELFAMMTDEISTGWPYKLVRSNIFELMIID